MPTNSYLSTHSQYREDLVIDTLFKYKSNGFYVDIGANDPDVLSNTKLFYNRGWNGINIEPEPNLHAKLCCHRGRDINLRVGVGPEPGIMTFYRMSADTLSSFNKQAALQAGKLYGGTLIGEEPTPVAKLADILADNLRGSSIDFMSVDAEGYDLAVLKSNDWSRFRPSVIIVEINVGGNDIIAFLQKQDYILIFDNYTNGIFVAKEFFNTIDDNIREDLRKLENSQGLRTVLPRTGEKNELYINHIYGHQSPSIIKAFKRGNVTILCTHLPIEGCDHYVYTNSFSYCGKMPGLNILLMLEPSVVLPGEYNDHVWQHFDHVFGLFDVLMDRSNKFHKIFFPRTDIPGANPVTDNQNSRENLYPLSGRKHAICMIGSNRSSHVPYELYSKRVEAARWFAEHSKIPFDVYGPPFALPNYRGPCPVSQKLAKIKEYRFNLCFENTNDPILAAGYVTEKILDCMESRTIPIYLGAPNIEQYVPEDCFIDLRKFADYADLEKYLRKMSNQDYHRYINAIDKWVTSGNLMKFAEAPLYNDLAKLCAESSRLNIENLFASDHVWEVCKAEPPTARQWQFVQKPALWTWKHLSKAEAPIIENGKLISRQHLTVCRKSDKVNTSEGKCFLIGKKPSIKVLAAGTKFFSGNARQGYDYGWWNHFDALKRFENIEMHFFDYATEAQQRGIAGMSECLQEVICKEKPDILFYCPLNSPVGILPDSLKSITGLTDTQTVIWMNNDHQLLNEDAESWAHCSDYIITLSPESAGYFAAAGFGSKVIKSQWGFNPYTYNTSNARHREISFCGAAKGIRSEILEKIKQSGLSVDVFGSGWHEDSFIPFYDMVNIFCQSRINLHLSDTPDLMNHQIRRRTFEVPGCHGFLLTHPADGLEEYYKPGKEIVVASSSEELIEKAKYYLAHEREREIIAQSGYERTLAEHTWSRRFIDIFKHIGFTAILRSISGMVGAPYFVESSKTSLLTTTENEAVTSIDSQNEVIETTINVMAYNQLEYTKICVESILHYTKGPFELLLTDNGSTDGTSEYFNAVKNFHPRTRIIRNFHNRIAETAVNHSTCAARGKYYVFVSNDTMVHEGWLENLIRHMESAPDIGWVGPRSNSISGPQFESAVYDSTETFQAFAAERANLHRGENFPVDRLAGMLVISKKQFFERIGGADPYLPANGRDGGYGFSDDDISLRFIIAGYKLLVANDVYIQHFGSVSAKHDRPDLFGSPQNLNKEKYLRKIRDNNRITMATDGNMIIKPYKLDDIIPVEERMVIRTPRICFVETEDNVTIAPDTESLYVDVAQIHNGQIFGDRGKTIQSLILQLLEDNSYDFLVLINSRLAPSPEIVSALTESALCHPDVGIMVPTGNYAPATHQPAETKKGIELIDYADLSTCTINLKITRPFRPGLANCENDNELLWFLQRRVRGEGYFIAKANNVEINYSRPILDHPCDAQVLPEQLVKERKYTEAAAIYRNDLEKDPTFAEAHYQLALIAREQQRTEEAILHAEQALGADPHHIESLIFLSGLFMAQNDWKRAKSFIGQANFKQPGNPEVKKIVEQYEQKMGEKAVLPKQKEGATIPCLTNSEFIKGRTSIIVTASSKHIRECITAIKKHTPEPYELIVIDNFITEELKKKLQKTVKEISSPCKILEHSPKAPLLQSVNLCINESTGEFIVLIMDDTIVSAGWLTGMLTCLKFAPEAGIIGPMTNTGSGLQRVADDLCQSVNYVDKCAATFKERFHHRRVPYRNIAGPCLLFKRTLVEKIGLLDERFAAGEFEVEDYCWRAELDGCINYIAGDVFVYNYGKKGLPGDRTIIDTKWTFSMDSLEGRKLAVLKSRELAAVMYQKGFMDQAVEALINCIKLIPDAKEIYYDLTLMFIESRRFSEAREVVGTMPEAVRNDVKGLGYAGYAMEGLGQDDEAAACADRILSQNEKYPAALNLKGVLAYKKDDREKAAYYFQKAIDADPGYGEAHINLGVLYRGLKQKEAALVHLKKGFILSPFIPDVNSIYYSVMSSAGMFSEAEDDFCEALKLYPCNKNLVFLCIDIFLQQSKYDAALHKIEDTLDVFGLDEGLLNAAIDIREKTGPLQIDKANKKGTLSLCMIVKNEEKYLIPCLKSVRDIVDEIIIVDTGSTDKTVAIARIFGAKLFEFSWTGDFSAARNHSLEQATGQWILVLDGDEVISPRDHKKIKEIISRKSPLHCAYSIATRNYLSTVGGMGWVKNSGEYPEEAGIGRVESVKVRLFTRNKNIFFSKPVHEILEYSLKKEKVSILPCEIIVHHYGKLDIQRDQKKGEDYYLLGKIKYETDPTHMKYIIELAKQAHLLGKNEEAAELFEKLLSLIAANPYSPSFEEIYQMTHGKPMLEIYTTLAAVYLGLHRFDDALNAARKIAADSNRREANIFVYAHCEIIAGSLTNAFRELEESLRISPDYLPNFIMMAVVFCLEGNKEKTGEYILLLQQKRVVITTIINTIAQELIAYGKKDGALLIINAMIEYKIYDQETIRLAGVVQNDMGSA